MILDAVQTLSELIALPSVNPMGRAVTGPEYFEYRVTDYLENLFRKLQIRYERQSVELKRDNIIARLDGATAPEAGGPLLLFDAHQDTVPVAGMTIEPWTPVVRDGRIFGRGACDIKGGLAAMLSALARLAAERPAGMPTVIFSATVNEEHGFSGALAVAKRWGQPGAIIPRQPDGAVIAEPTELDVVVAHKGVVRWRLHTRGRAGHSSRPESAQNAIYRMAPVLAAIARYATDVVPGLGQHSLCGRPSLSVGTIQGGLSVNTVPDRAMIEIDRRLLPGENPATAYRHATDYLSQAVPDADWIEHDPPYMQTAGLADRNNGPLAVQLIAAARCVTGGGAAVGVPYGTNAAAYSAAGVPSVVFGPGSIAQAHTADEWLALDQLERASEVYYRFAADFCK
jgi:acetylornithine deacetylase/succinyl-diaminopimelate desuccinylase-like protein